MEKENPIVAGRESRFWPRLNPTAAILVVIAFGAAAWYGTRFLVQHFDRPHGPQWQEVRVDLVFPAPLQDRSGNTAFVYEPVNSIIVMTEERPSVKVSPVRNDERGRPSIAWGIPPNVVTLPFVESVLLIRLPDGREGQFKIAAGSANKFGRRYHRPESGAENSMLQKAIEVIDDPAERAKALEFLGTFRGREVSSSTIRPLAALILQNDAGLMREFEAAFANPANFYRLFDPNRKFTTPDRLLIDFAQSKHWLWDIDWHEDPAEILEMMRDLSRVTSAPIDLSDVSIQKNEEVGKFLSRLGRLFKATDVRLVCLDLGDDSYPITIIRADAVEELCTLWKSAPDHKCFVLGDE